MEYFEKNFKIVDEPIEPDVSEKKADKPDPRVRAALWQEYQYGILKIPSQYSDMANELRKSLESPVLPSKCAKLIEEFLVCVDGNAAKITETLTECAKELPEKYPTLEKLQKASLSWISNKYLDKFEHLKPKADEIIESIRTHWNIDELTLKSNKEQTQATD